MIMSDGQDTFLSTQRRNLEDAFFKERDKVLIENLQKIKMMKETKDTLSRVSGIRNDAVLEKLVTLGVRLETLASLALVPLVEVAWADGSISAKEASAVLAAADKNGMKKDGIEGEILREWLANKPPNDLIEAWIHYIQALCAKLTCEEKTALKNDLVGNARAVAEASGGILGIGAISKQEKATLEKLEKAFECYC